MNSRQLKKVSIKGFKSLKSVDIELTNLNVLIGSNGSGKSNFISVFSLLKAVIERNFQIYVAEASGANSLMFNGRKTTERISFEFYFGQNSYSFSLKANDDDSLFFESEYFSYNGNFNNDTPLGYGHSESKWNQEPRNDIYKYIQPVLSNQQWRVYHFHDTGRNARIKQSCKIDNDAQLLADASNLAAFLYRLKNEFQDNYQAILSYIKLIAPYFDDFYLQPNSDNISLRWKQSGNEDIFNANQLSDGTLRFICLTTLFLQPRTLLPETIVIDEPELGLHPYAIAVLSALIKKVSIYKQVIVATQSADLLSEFSPENIITVTRQNNETILKRLTAESLKIWLEEDYSLGELWKKNILGARQ